MKLILAILLISQLTFADCEDLIKAGEASEQACNVTIGAYRTLVSDQDKLILELTKQRNDLAKEAVSTQPLLPWYLWALVGAAGATIAIGVRR